MKAIIICISIDVKIVKKKHILKHKKNVFFQWCAGARVYIFVRLFDQFFIISRHV